MEEVSANCRQHIKEKKHSRRKNREIINSNSCFDNDSEMSIIGKIWKVFTILLEEYTPIRHQTFNTIDNSINVSSSPQYDSSSVFSSSYVMACIAIERESQRQLALLEDRISAQLNSKHQQDQQQQTQIQQYQVS